MHYHSKLIETFCNNLSSFYLGFEPLYYKKNVKWEGGEIDIVLMGELEQALVEVKSNPKNMHKFTHEQFNHYREFDPSAQVYLLMGTDDYSLDPEKLRLIRFWPL